MRLDASDFGHLALCQLFGLLRLLLDGRDLVVGLLTLGGALVSSLDLARRFGSGILDIVWVDRARVEAEGADLVRDVLRDLDTDLETCTPTFPRQSADPAPLRESENVPSMRVSGNNGARAMLSPPKPQPTSANSTFLPFKLTLP